MITKVVEVTNDGFNWGKFLLIRFTDEWRTWTSPIGGGPLLRQLGWSPEFLWVLDLQTGEGAFFRPGGRAESDLEKHKIWCCPMFQPFLKWLYLQDLDDLDALPAMLDLKDAPGALAGYRRTGPGSEDVQIRVREKTRGRSKKVQWEATYDPKEWSRVFIGRSPAEAVGYALITYNQQGNLSARLAVVFEDPGQIPDAP